MAASLKFATFFLSALCLLSLMGQAYGQLSVKGQVYCDTCRTQFVTRISEYMKGATVRLECRGRENGTLTFSEEATTDETGHYSIDVVGDHEEDLCEVIPMQSPNPDCAEVSKEEFVRKAATISLTKNNGIASGARQANPLGFMKAKPLPECTEVLKELGLTKQGYVDPAEAAQASP